MARQRPVVSFTEAYNANIARMFNGDVVTATVLNKVMMLWAGGTPRKDGFNWLKDDQMAEQLGVSKRTVIRSFEKLQKAELVECKKAYIVGASVSCRHFKPTERAIFLLCNTEKAKSPLRLCQNVTTRLCQNVTSFNNNYKYNSKYNKIKKTNTLTNERKYSPPLADGCVATRHISSSLVPAFDFESKSVKSSNSVSQTKRKKSSGSELDVLPDSPVTISAGGSQGVATPVNDDPFAGEVSVDVDLEKRMREKRLAKRAKYQRGYSAAEAAFRIAGIKKKPEGLIIKRMVELFDLGYTMYDIELIAKRAIQHDYYKTQDVMYWYSQRGVLQLNNDKWWKGYKDRKRFELGSY